MIMKQEMEFSVRESNIAVAQRIKNFRERQHYSQLELAIKAGISQGFLAMVESSRKVPTLTTVFKIAYALNLHPSALFEDIPADREAAKERIIGLIRREL